MLFGGYPGAASFVTGATPDPSRWRRYILDSLIETSISRDILLMNRIDKPALLRLLFDLGCRHSGQILSYTKMLGQLHDAGNTTTLAHYLELLAGAGISQRTLHEQLWRGSLPMANQLALDAIPSFQLAYLRTYIERDARLLGEVSDWQLFGRFVQLASALTAQEINASHLGREIGLTPKTAARWLATLAATYQWFELPAFHGSTVKRVTSRRKGHIADTGLACAAQQISSPAALARHPQVGSLFESFVFAEIRKRAGTLATPPAMYHWRTSGGAEVDIVLERDGLLYPIEVKLASQRSGNDSRGLQAFRATYPSARVAPGLLMCASRTTYRVGPNEWAVPYNLG